MKFIPYGKQKIDHNDIKLIRKAAFSDKITTGKFVKLFEKKLRDFFNVKHALTCSSGTAALHLAFSAIEIKPGDIVIVPSINFISTCNILQLMRAKIYLADVDPITGQITSETLIKCIKKNNLKKIKAVVTMYLGGHIYENIEIFKLKKKYKFLIVEDSCHALGSRYKFKKNLYHIGSCKHSDISTFSFHPLKSITSGEGGTITTNNDTYHKKAELFRSHGIERGKNHWNYQINSPGLNYRLSDLNCALGISQLKKINKFMKKREYISKKYKSFLSSLIKEKLIKFLPESKENYSSNHLFILNINFKKIKKTKDNFFNFMLKHKIYCQYHYIPIYNFENFRYLKKNMVNTKSYFANSVSLPIYFELSNRQQKKIIKILFKFFGKNEIKNN